MPAMQPTTPTVDARSGCVYGRSKHELNAGWDRYDVIAGAIAMLVVAWVFTLKLRTFYELGYTSDLFVSVQLARSWLEGRGLLVNNYFEHILASHTYFLLLPLGLIAKPFGAPGLLFLLAASVGVTYFFAVRILRLLGTGGLLSLGSAGLLLSSPLSVAFYSEHLYGFHVEDLTPALCLMLFYFLLRRCSHVAMLLAFAAIAVKEDAPFVVASIAIMAAVETWISSAGEPSLRRVNQPVMFTFTLAVLAIPILFTITSTQAGPDYIAYRVGLGDSRNIRGFSALFRFIAADVPSWLGSSVVREWLWIMLVGSFGMIVLRPYYLPVGVVTTLVAWLINRGDLLWAPRFHLALAFLWTATLVAFASLVRMSRSTARQTRQTIAVITVIIVALSTFAQFELVPQAREAYFLRSHSPYSPLERQQADALFARYRHEAKPDDPVAASPHLFRYAHDRNLFWLDRLIDRPAPTWILGDSSNNFGYGKTMYLKNSAAFDSWDRCLLRISDYAVVDRRGRFVLLKRKK
jgi:uncharacterized membrane protein